MLQNFNDFKNLIAEYGQYIPNLNEGWKKIKQTASHKVDEDINQRLKLIKDCLEAILRTTLEEVKENEGKFKTDSQIESVLMASAALYIILLNQNEVIGSFGNIEEYDSFEEEPDLPFEE